MMPWWFWVLLWTALLLGTVLFLVLSGIKLFRGLRRMLDEASLSMDRLSDPFGRMPLHPETASGTGNGPGAPFRDAEIVREEYEAGKEERREARREARIARKYAKGQPQRVSDFGLF